MFFNFGKKYLSCEWLEHGIHFGSDGLFHCTECFHEDFDFTPVVERNEFNTYDYETFFKKKKEKRKEIKKKMPKSCELCHVSEKKVWDNKEIITRMAITANTTCNADCIYCAAHKDKKVFNSTPDIKIYDFLVDLFKKKKIDKNCEVQFGGGEPVLHSEFEDVLTLFTEKLVSKIKIHSSAINYSKSIENLISQSRCMLVVSVDSGNPELYHRIKSVDKSDIVWQNIKKYCHAQKYSENQIQVYTKYIIIPEVNDREEYIEEFIRKSKESGVNAVNIDLENVWYLENFENQEAIKPIFHYIKYMEKLAKDYDIHIFPYQVIIKLKNKYPEFYND